MNPRINALLQKGVKERVYPGAVLLVAVSGRIVEFCAVGYSQLLPYPISMKRKTIFDLASLTKPLATSLAIMRLVEDGLIGLDMPVSEILPLPPQNRKITLRTLLSHSSGLPSWRPYYLKLVNYPMALRKDIIRGWILKEELSFSPGKNELYSDLGFMLLEWIIEYITNIKMRDFLIKLYAPLNLNKAFLSYPEHKIKRDEFAATGFCLWRKRIVQGEVHDENAFSMGGYSGHAGLFCTAMDVFIISDMLLGHYSGRRGDIFKRITLEEFFRKQNKRWTLGWDTPAPESSSSGSLFSENSVGHLGFTGTSIWMDLEKEIIIIFLTNRTYPTRQNEKIRQFRPLIHDTIMRELS